MMGDSSINWLNVDFDDDDDDADDEMMICIISYSYREDKSPLKDWA
jgi:hypothetical protein